MSLPTISPMSSRSDKKNQQQHDTETCRCASHSQISRSRVTFSLHSPGSHIWGSSCTILHALLNRSGPTSWRCSFMSNRVRRRTTFDYGTLTIYLVTHLSNALLLFFRAPLENWAAQFLLAFCIRLMCNPRGELLLPAGWKRFFLARCNINEHNLPPVSNCAHVKLHVEQPGTSCVFIQPLEKSKHLSYKMQPPFNIPCMGTRYLQQDPHTSFEILKKLGRKYKHIEKHYE